jgi:hypothetical protein
MSWQQHHPHHSQQYPSFPQQQQHHSYQMQWQNPVVPNMAPGTHYIPNMAPPVYYPQYPPPPARTPRRNSRRSFKGNNNRGRNSRKFGAEEEEVYWMKDYEEFNQSAPQSVDQQKNDDEDDEVEEGETSEVEVLSEKKKQLQQKFAELEICEFVNVINIPDGIIQAAKKVVKSANDSKLSCAIISTSLKLKDLLKKENWIQNSICQSSPHDESLFSKHDVIVLAVDPTGPVPSYQHLLNIAGNANRALFVVSFHNALAVKVKEMFDWFLSDENWRFSTDPEQLED